MYTIYPGIAEGPSIVRHRGLSAGMELFREDIVPSPGFRVGWDVLPEGVRAVTSRWRCPICGFLYEGFEPPQECPSCLQPGDTFEFVDDDEAYLDEIDGAEDYG